MRRRQVWINVYLILVIVSGYVNGDRASAARFVAYFPLSAETITTAPGDELSEQNGDTSQPPSHPGLAESTWASWAQYGDTWQQHFRDPADVAVRQRLGLGDDDVVIREGNATASETAGLPRGRTLRFETKHFIVVTQLPRQRIESIARDLERYYWVWTQLFFPLWRDRDTWDQATKSTRPRLTTKHRVVLLADAAQYAAVLRNVGPGVEQSTGFYSDLRRVTYLRADEGDGATRCHELTHQLLAEATGSRLKGRPGERRDFWLVEGIACYMESCQFNIHSASIGGWQASRLQYARHRVLAQGDDMPLPQLASEGRLQVQRRGDLSRWYSFAAAYVHQMIDNDDGQGLVDCLAQLAAVYQTSGIVIAGRDRGNDTPTALANYLTLDDQQLTPIAFDGLERLCFARTKTTAAGLSQIVPQSHLKWLDLAYLPITGDDVKRLCADPSSLEQLSLEATAIDDSIRTWIATAKSLAELDLSSTSAGDLVIDMLPSAAPIKTLWLTGSRVSDSSINRIAAIPTLQQVDLQQTQVTESGIARLRAARPQLKINPLQVTAQ